MALMGRLRVSITLQKASSTLQKAGYTLQFAASTLQLAGYTPQKAACTLQFAALTLQKAGCTMQKAALTLQRAGCTMQFAAYTRPSLLFAAASAAAITGWGLAKPSAARTLSRVNLRDFEINECVEHPSLRSFGAGAASASGRATP